MRDDAATEAAVISVAAAGKRNGGRTDRDRGEAAALAVGTGAAPQQTRAGDGSGDREWTSASRSQSAGRPPPITARTATAALTGRRGGRARAGIERSYTHTSARAGRQKHARNARARAMLYSERALEGSPAQERQRGRKAGGRRARR